MSLRLCLLACLVAAVCATKSSSEDLRPSNWLTPSELENTPSLNDINWELLEREPLQRGSELLEKVYHLAHIKHDLTPSFVPSPSNVPVWIIRPNGQKVQAKLTNYVEKVQTLPNFGEEEVTIVLTGLPQTTPTIKKAMRKLEQAYMQRYNLQEQQKASMMQFNGQKSRENEPTSSEEASDEWKSAKTSNGDLIVIDLGSALTSFKRYALLDIPSTGAMIGETLVDMTNKGVPQEIIHMIGQGIGAHVAGAAANEFTSRTGHKLRRITGLDPSKIIAKRRDSLAGLSRGDADFVDCIHTSTRGIGSSMRCGDVDFFPNGPGKGVPGAKNVIEAMMRATRYFAESVRPGNERNFPAVPAKSLKQYKENNGFGRRGYMGIDTEFDLNGDYMLEVNEKSPFGKRTPAQMQISYHGMHKMN